MAKGKRQDDGLLYVGKDKRSGKLKYSATLRKKKGGKLIVDTERVIYADSKGEALVEKARILAGLVAEKLGTKPHSDIAIGAAFDEWLSTLRPGTRVSYSSYVKKLVSAVGRDHPLHKVTAQEIQRVIATAKVLDRTAGMIRTATKVFLEWAKEQGYIASNVALETSKRRTRQTSKELIAGMRPDTVRKSMTMDEYARWLAELRRMDEEIGVMAGTQFFLGARFGEVSALRWSDIDFETGVVQIRFAQMLGDIGPPKNKKSRTAGLGPGWLRVLEAHRARLLSIGRPHADEWCFPWRGDVRRKHAGVLYDYQVVNDAYRAAMVACGIELGPSTHALRHTMISLSEQARGDGFGLVAERMAGLYGAPKALQDVVGHADARMTARYTEVPGNVVVSFATALEKKLKGGGKGG